MMRYHLPRQVRHVNIYTMAHNSKGRRAAFRTLKKDHTAVGHVDVTVEFRIPIPKHLAEVDEAGQLVYARAQVFKIVSTGQRMYLPTAAFRLEAITDRRAWNKWLGEHADTGLENGFGALPAYVTD